MPNNSNAFCFTNFLCLTITITITNYIISHDNYIYYSHHHVYLLKGTLIQNYISFDVVPFYVTLNHGLALNNLVISH